MPTADRDQLVAILTYHVVPGRVMAKEVVTLESAPTVQGSALAIAVDGSTVSVNGAKIVKTDVAGSNDVIHVIDAVLLPLSSN